VRHCEGVHREYVPYGKIIVIAVDGETRIQTALITESPRRVC
jgi:hypothetical protein